MTMPNRNNATAFSHPWLQNLDKDDSSVQEPWAEPISHDGIINLDLPELQDIISTTKGLSESLLRLPRLDEFRFEGALSEHVAEKDLLASTPTQGSSSQTHPIPEDDLAEDVWANTPGITLTEKIPTWKSWEHFYRQDAKKGNVLLSESGPTVWDAAVQKHLEHRSDHEAQKNPILVIRQDAGIRALFLLGIGRRSFLSPSSSDASRSKLTISGLSIESLQSLISRFHQVGQAFKYLRTMPERIAKAKEASPTGVALAKSLVAATEVLEDYLVNAAPRLKTVLQLQATFQVPEILLARLEGLARQCKDLHHHQSILDLVFAFVEDCEVSDMWLIHVALLLLARVSRPWLDSLSRSVTDDVNHQSPLDAPRFVSEEDRESIDQIRRNLLILKKHDKSHYLDRVRSGTSSALVLELASSWEDVAKIHLKAKDYGIQVLAALSIIDSRGRPGRLHDSSKEDYTGRLTDNASGTIFQDPFKLSEGEFTAHFIRSFAKFEDRIDKITYDDFESALVGTLSQKQSENRTSDFAPETSLISTLSFAPILSVQTKLLSFLVLRCFSQDHRLVHHLETMYAFSLFGSGTFSYLLTNALFSPNLHSTEKQRGKKDTSTMANAASGKLGLRLGSRSTWPPASSELHLALLDVIEEAYWEHFPRSDRRGLSEYEPGEGISSSISFSIRPLSEEEIQKCMDPDSLNALDFLRISYKSSEALEPVIGNGCIDVYDRIFRTMLRVARVLYIATQLHQSGKSKSDGRNHKDGLVLSERRYRLEAYLFISTISAYFHTSISTAWTIFIRYVRAVESVIAKQIPTEALEARNSLISLQLRHKEMLDELRSALLLQHDQSDMLHNLENILVDVLAAAKESVQPDSFRSLDASARLKDFRGKVNIFLRSCREVRSDHSIQKQHLIVGRTTTSGVERLLSRLALAGWETK